MGRPWSTYVGAPEPIQASVSRAVCPRGRKLRPAAVASAFETSPWPRHAGSTIQTEGQTPDVSAAAVLARLEELGLLPDGVLA